MYNKFCEFQAHLLIYLYVLLFNWLNIMINDSLIISKKIYFLINNKSMIQSIYLKKLLQLRTIETFVSNKIIFYSSHEKRYRKICNVSIINITLKLYNLLDNCMYISIMYEIDINKNSIKQNLFNCKEPHLFYYN